jgi:hypothetical protein
VKQDTVVNKTVQAYNQKVAASGGRKMHAGIVKREASIAAFSTTAIRLWYWLRNSVVQPPANPASANYPLYLFFIIL